MLVNTALALARLCPPLPPAPCVWSVRHLNAPYRTTVKLESYFWQEIEVLAKDCGLSWRQWAEAILKAKPFGANSASWLRINCLQGTKESYGKKTTC